MYLPCPLRYSMTRTASSCKARFLSSYLRLSSAITLIHSRPPVRSLYLCAGKYRRQQDSKVRSQTTAAHIQKKKRAYLHRRTLSPFMITVVCRFQHLFIGQSATPLAYACSPRQGYSLRCRRRWRRESPPTVFRV